MSAKPHYPRAVYSFQCLFTCAAHSNQPPDTVKLMHGIIEIFVDTLGMTQMLHCEAYVFIKYILGVVGGHPHHK